MGKNKGTRKKRLAKISALIVVIAMLFNSIPANAAENENVEDLFYYPEETVINHIDEEYNPELDGSTMGGPRGHEFIPGKVVTIQGTCRTKGKKITYCKAVNCTIHDPVVESTTKNPNNHENKTYFSTDPTCTTSGSAGYRCTACGTERITQVIDSYGHSESTATCSRPSVCQRCGITISGKDYNNHDGKSSFYEAPKCESEGRKGWRCSGCGTEYVSQTYDSLDHLPSEATCTEASVCKREGCGKKISDKLDHIWKRTKDGDYQCDRCSIKKPASEVNAPQNEVPEYLSAVNVVTETIADPINPFTGAHEIDFKALSVGGAQKLTVGISYRSDKSLQGIFGKGFSWNYESFIEEKDGEIYLYHTPSSYVAYVLKGDNSYYVTEADGGENDKLYKNSDGTVTLNSNGKAFDYNPEGKLCKVTDKTGLVATINYTENTIVLKDGVSGQTITLSLNENGLVEKVSGSGTSEAFFEYNEEDLLVKFTDVDGFVTRYTYDEEGRVLTGIDNDGHVFFEDIYDEEGRVIKQKDAKGNESFFSYESNGENGRKTVYTDRNGNTRTYIFDSVGRLLSLTDEEGNITTNTYDARGNLIKKTDALSGSVSMEYDERNNLVKSTDALGNATVYTYDSNDNLTKVTYPDGSKALHEYDLNNRVVKSTDVRGLVTTYQYNTAGYLTKTVSGSKTVKYTYKNGNLNTLTDPKGNTTVYSYDTNGNLVQTKAADGTITNYSVSPSGAVKSVRNALGNRKYYTLNFAGDPLTVKDEAGNKTKYTYDERGLLTKITDSKGNKTEYFYDVEERLVKTVYPDGSFTENRYDKTGNLIASIDGEGNTTAFEYDAAGRLVGETDADGNSTFITYDAAGNVVSRKDAKGNATSYSYDSMGRLLTVTNPYGGVTEYTYNTAGDVISVKDPCGNVTTFTYNKYGNKASETDPNGNTTSFGYDYNGNLSRRINALNEETVYEYDKCNRLVTTRTGEASVTIEYDSLGRTVSTTDPNGNKTEKRYDAVGNVSKVIDALGNETAYGYDSNSNLVSVTDAKGHVTTYTVDSLNRVTATTDAFNLTTTYSYNKNGQRKAAVNPMGGVSTCIFDKTGNTTSLVGPEGAATSFTYDSNGNMSSVSTVGGNERQYTYNALNLADTLTNGRGQETTYEYDLCGRIVKSTSPEGVTTYTYDSNSNVLSVTDGNGTVSRTYDALNRVTSVTDTKGRVVSYEYDTYGNLKTLTYPDNSKVTYTYDLCGNIKSVTDWEGRVTSYSYDALNREVEAVNANNTKTVKEYDSVGNIVRIAEYNTVTGSLIDESVLVYDDINRLVSETYTVRNFKYDYYYDDLSRVLKRTVTDTYTGEVSYQETFDYDKAGNIIGVGQNEWKGNLSYVAQDNRIESYEDLGFSFDNDGNLTGTLLGGQAKPNVNGFIAKDGGATLSYDSKNRLVRGVLEATGELIGDYAGIPVSARLIQGFGYDAEDYRIYASSEAELTLDRLAALLLEQSNLSNKEFEATLEENLDESLNDIEDIREEVTGTEEQTGETEPAEEPVTEPEIGEGGDVSGEDVSGDEAVNDGPEEDNASSIENCVSEDEQTEETYEEVTEPEEDSAEEAVAEEPTEGTGETQAEESIEEPAEEQTEQSDEEVSEDTLEFEEIPETKDEWNLSGEESEVLEELSLETYEEMLSSSLRAALPEANSTLVEFCYDRENKNLLVSFYDDGTIKKYVYGNGLIGSYEMTASSQTPKYRVYLYDLRGSLTLTTDKSGSITSEYRYSTYGNRSVVSGNKTSELGYCARDGVLTETTGMLYMRARYYYPDLMRFINEDIITGDISNSGSLNRYTYVEGNPATMIDPFGLCADKSNNVCGNNVFVKQTRIEKLKEILLKSGWDSSAVTDYMVSSLYINLLKYEILSEEQICMFLAQCQFESVNGTERTERGSKSYFEEKSYGIEYRGSGYIHLTHKGGYEGFAIYLMLRDYPELKGEKDGHNYRYTSRDHENNLDVVTKRFNDIVDYAHELSIDVEKYTKIVNGDGNFVAADYVARHYAWESSAYYWTVSKGLNDKVANGMNIDGVSYRVLGGYSESWVDRKHNYTTIKANYESIGFSMTGD